MSAFQRQIKKTFTKTQDDLLSLIIKTNVKWDKDKSDNKIVETDKNNDTDEKEN